MSERRILVVEASTELGKAVRTGFAQYGADYAILTAHSVPDALQWTNNLPIDLMIVEHSGPAGINGLEMLEHVKEFPVPVRIVLVAEPHREDDRIAALESGCDTFLLKPLPEDKFLALMYEMLQPQQGFSGRVINMKLEDLIQMFCYRKDSTMMTIVHGGARGTVYLTEGEIVHAQYGNMTGIDAFYEILRWETGEFLSQVTFTVPEKTVSMDWQSLLMEGIRERDEIKHALGPSEAVPVTYEELLSGGNGGATDPAAAEMPTEPAKRIMIVDDSRFIRRIVQEIVQSDPELIVAGYATNGQEALAKIDELKPDLILLDWDMPVMKGSTTLMHIMIRSPCPVVILSGFVGGVGANPFDLLCIGAVDFLRKPQNNWRTDGRADDLVRRIKEACAIKYERIRRVKIPSPLPDEHTSEGTGISPVFLSVFGSFVGGAVDLIRVVPSLPEGLNTALVCIHDMQQEAIGSFVDYLAGRSRMPVKRAEEGEPLEEGICYLHPATAPVELAKEGDAIVLKFLTEVPGGRVFDHFLMSASKIMGRNLLAALLSGGGTQGVEGLRAVKEVDGITLAQEPKLSTDPRVAEAAIAEGIVDVVCPADKMAETFRNLIS